MGVVLLQILQWILRIILFLLILVLVLGIIILIVPIRYRAEWNFMEKKPGARGKITWFFYLIYMRFNYEEEFRMQVKICGFKIFDSMDEGKKPQKTKKKNENNVQNEVQETIESNDVDDFVSLEKEMEEEAELAPQILDKKIEKIESKKADNSQKDYEISEETESHKEKKTFSEKIDDIKTKIQDLIQKIKDIIVKIQEGKLKIEHYLELWNRNETRITFGRAKTKLGRMIKAILPRKWIITGEIGFENPCTTGQLMGALGAMYPILGNKVQIVPNFEEQVINAEGNLKGHIRLGNLLYQVVSLLLNRHCFKFIKLIFDELSGSKIDKKKQNA